MVRATRWRAVRTWSGQDPDGGAGAPPCAGVAAGSGGRSAAGQGAAAGETQARPHPRGVQRDTLGLLQTGGWPEGGRVSGWKPLTRCGRPEGRGRGPAPALAFGTGGSGHPLLLLFSAGQGTLGTPRCQCAFLPGLGGLREAPRGPGGATELVRTAALPRAARERSASRRGNPAEGKRPQEGLDPGGCGASAATPGNSGVGGEEGMWNKQNSWVRAMRAKVCRGVGGALM